MTNCANGDNPIVAHHEIATFDHFGSAHRQEPSTMQNQSAARRIGEGCERHVDSRECGPAVRLNLGQEERATLAEEHTTSIM
jgi:hypothetical protein